MDTNVQTEWEQSAELGELAKALAAAQGEMENAAKSRDNPFFKSKYADLASIKDVSQAALTKNVLAMTAQNFSRGPDAGVRMMLLHGSGQYLACICTTTPKDRGPQAMGSCWSYLRRYAKSALLDIATEDDDGEKAEGRDKNAKPPGANWKPANESGRSAPKGASGTSTTATAPTTTGATSRDPADDGTPITPGTLEDLRFAATGKYPKGKDAKMWLKGLTGIDDPAALSEFEGQKALKVLGM